MSYVPDTPGVSHKKLMIVVKIVVMMIVVVLLAGCGGAAQRDEPAGLGDSYFPQLGNPGYQVEHYDLQVRYDPASKQLTGVATIDAQTTEPVTQLGFDLSGLIVDEVNIDGEPAVHATDKDKLQITLPQPADAGDEVTVAVSYHGNPEPLASPMLGSNGFHTTADGAFVIGQPLSASTWYPVNDHPQDKATYTVAVTVPQGLAAVSNGTPEGQHTHDGWTTWRWAEQTPMASYLTTVAIGDYRVESTVHTDGRPVVTAVHADLPAAVDAQLAQTPQIADVLAQWFGPYPVDAYGGIALADPRVSFALETQSRPVYGPSFFRAPGSGEVSDATWVIVHELAHQWFGNSVSLGDWRDIWLNEGFATYAEWLWFEHTGGDTVQETFDLYWHGPGAEEQFWSVPPGDPGPQRLFHRAVYDRGAMAVHALRLTVGDEAFFEIVQRWTHEYRDGTVTTADLVALAEQVSGMPLAGLFDDWVYSTARPPRP